MNCRICKNSKLKHIFKIPESKRGNKIIECMRCGVLQSFNSKLYNPKLDPHSLKFDGERNISPTDGVSWGNIRHGKGLRFDSHKHLLFKLIQKEKIKRVFDDGANRGHFAKFSNSHNLLYSGVEPDILCFDSYKKNYGIKNIYTENYNDDKKYDLIYSSHTLEHVDDVEKHLKILSKKLKKNKFFFLDLPNTYQIEYENFVFEEYFVEKHQTHFFITDIINLFCAFNYSLMNINADPFNMTFIFKYLGEKRVLLSNFNKEKNRNNKKIINDYYLKFFDGKKISKSIAKKINKLSSKKIIIYGGGRILNRLVNSGLNINKIDFVIDNYLYDKIKYPNIKIFHSSKLRSISKSQKILILARSSTSEIIKSLNQMKLNNIIELRHLV